MMKRSRRQFLSNLIRATLGVTATCVLQPLMAHQQPNNFDTFMKFSHLITEEEKLNLEFGAICWRYVQHYSSPEHWVAMQNFVQLSDPDAQRQALLHDASLKSIAYHTLLVWYKGDITSINPTGDDVKIAYIHALKWKAMGIPARGLCFPNWSKGCTT